MNIITSQPTQNTFILPQLDPLESAIGAMPELSTKTIRIFKACLKEMHSPYPARIFSKKIFKLKTTAVRKSINTFEYLRDHKTQHQCFATARAVANTACLAGIPLANKLAQTALWQTLGPIGFCMAYSIFGCYNKSSAKNQSILENTFDFFAHLSFYLQLRSSIPIAFFFFKSCCIDPNIGPYWAADEAINEIPKRIEVAKRIISYTDLPSPDFNDLIAFCKEEKNLTSLQHQIQLNLETLEKYREDWFIETKPNEEPISDNLPSNVRPPTIEMIALMPFRRNTEFAPPKPQISTVFKNKSGYVFKKTFFILPRIEELSLAEEETSSNQTLEEKNEEFVFLDLQKYLDNRSATTNSQPQSPNDKSYQDKDSEIDVAAEKKNNFLRIENEIKQHKTALQELSCLIEYAKNLSTQPLFT